MLGMVARRAHAAERRGHFAGEDQVGRFHRGPCCAQGGLQRPGVHVGVGIDVKVALGGRVRKEFTHIQRGMRATQLLLGGQWRIVGVHVVQQALDQQVVVDRSKALGAFRVVGSHFVAGAIGVGNESGQQTSLLVFYCS
jgi:hypothetical protein